MMNNSTIQDRYPSHYALMLQFAPTAIKVERVFTIIWYIIGFVGNPVSAVIWFGRRMRRNNSSAIYLATLAVSDFVFLILHLLQTLQSAWGHSIYNAQGGCEPFMFFFYIPQYLSVILVAGFTIERYTAVCHPFLKEKWCTVQRACIIVGACIVFSTMISSAQIYIWTYDKGLNECSIRPEAQEGGSTGFWHLWTWVVDMIFFGALPLVVLAFNVLVLREIIKLSKNGVITRQQNRSGNNTASTLTLLSVSFFLVIAMLAATIVTCIQPAFHMGDMNLSDEEARQDPTWSALFTYLDVRKTVDAICLSHYACYFFIYCLTGKHFRREVVYLITCYGKVHFLDFLLFKNHKGERYSMVSSNGHTLATETCTTSAYTTTM